MGSSPGGLVVKRLKQQAQVGSLAGGNEIPHACLQRSFKKEKKKRGNMGRSKIEASRRL